MHILAFSALHMAHAAHPGTFKIFGWNAPELLGQVLHWIARLFKVLAIGFSFLLLFTLGFTSTGGWRLIQMLFLIAIGLIGLPSITPKIQQWLGNITKGAAIGSTGASIWIVVILSVILALTIFSTIIRNPAQSGEV